MYRLLIVISLFIIGFSSGPVRADKLDAFHNQVNVSYAAYRAGWYYLRMGTPGLASLELGTALDEWESLIATYKDNPPDELKDDAKFADDLARVSSLLSAGLDQAAAGATKQSRKTIAPIRGILYELRKRNGIRLYADCVSELNGAADPLLHYRRNAKSLAKPDVNARVRKDATRYIDLFNECLAMAPSVYADDPEYTGFMEGYAKSVNDMPKALDAEDAAFMIRVLRELLSFDRIIYFRYGG